MPRRWQPGRNGGRGLAGDLVGAGRARRPRSRRAHVLVSRSALFFSKLAVVTFGGAYALLAYMAQGWSRRRLAEPRRDGRRPRPRRDDARAADPGDQFVGFLAGHAQRRRASDPLSRPTLGRGDDTWVTFAPSFLWIFAGAPFIEDCARSRHARRRARRHHGRGGRGRGSSSRALVRPHVLFRQSVRETIVGPLHLLYVDPG